MKNRTNFLSLFLFIPAAFNCYFVKQYTFDISTPTLINIGF